VKKLTKKNTHTIFISDTPYTFVPGCYKRGTSNRLLVFLTDEKIFTSDMPSVCIPFRREHPPLPLHKLHWWMFRKQDSALVLVPVTTKVQTPQFCLSDE